MTDGDTLSLRAADAKPSVSTTVTKVFIAWSLSMSAQMNGKVIEAPAGRRQASERQGYQ
jgi:hypothetical protein